MAKAQVARIAVPVVVRVVRISILKGLEALLLLLGFPGLRFQMGGGGLLISSYRLALGSGKERSAASGRESCAVSGAASVVFIIVLVAYDE